MNVAGTGITPFDIQVMPDYRPKTQLSIKWRQMADGNWKGTDRGTSADIYDADVRIYGKEAVIDDFIDEIEANRAASAHALTLSSFEDTEHFFGVDVDHSGSISATILNIGKRTQNTWKGWGLDMTLRAISPSFSGSSSLPTLGYLDIGAIGDSNYTVNKIDSYDGTFHYLDHDNDIGTFTGTFTLASSDMQKIRRYIATQRTGNFTLADNFGFADPFGSRSPGSYSYTTKLIEWEDLGMWGVHWWKIKLKFAEVI